MNKICLLSFLLLSICFSSHSQSLRLLKDINAVDSMGLGTEFRYIAVMGDTVYACASTGVNSYGLWMSDGTVAGTKMLKSFGIGGSFYILEHSLAFGGKLIFSAGNSVWSTDGTVSGTQLIMEFEELVQEVVSMDSYVLFLTRNGSNTEVWRSDGTASGTTQVGSVPGFYYGDGAARMGNEFYFSAYQALCKTDGITVQVVSDINTTGFDGIRGVAAFNGKVWFGATDGIHGMELWSSDGTASGTVMLDDYNPGAGDGMVAEDGFALVDGRLFFVSDDGAVAVGTELRITDGTLAGTSILEHAPGASGIQCEKLHSSTHHVFFSDDITQTMVAADTSGTLTLATSTTLSMNPYHSVHMGDSLFFFGIHPMGSVWRSDGTVAGTEMISPVGSYFPWCLGTNGEHVYYSTGINGNQLKRLWKTDGSLAGTQAMPLISTGPSSSNPSSPTVMGNQVVFVAADSAYGEELWRTDGTTNGTYLVKDIAPGNGSIEIGQKILWNGSLYISIRNDASGQELWKTDGTGAGTLMLADIQPGAQGSNPVLFYPTDQYLYFSVEDPQHGPALWRTDGTPVGTAFFMDFTSFFDRGHARGISQLGTNTLFSVNSADGVMQLWICNPAASTSTLLTSFYSNLYIGDGVYFANQLFFIAPNNTLWSTKGTPATTAQFGTFYSVNRIWGVWNGELYFAGEVAGNIGIELYKTDGTVQGTSLVKDIYPASGDGYPDLLEWTDDWMYFTAVTATFGEELWRSDGTASGTTMVADLSPGSLYLQVLDHALLDNKLYFGANTAAEGRELYVVDTAGNVQLHSLCPGTTSSYREMIGPTDQGLLFQGFGYDSGLNLFVLGSGGISMLPDITGDPQSVYVDWAVPLGSGFVMAANTPMVGEELYFLDSIQGIPTEVESGEPPLAAAELVVYPQPAGDVVNLRLTGRQIEGYALMDVTGRVWQEGKAGGQAELRLNLEALSAGMYLVRMKMVNGMTVTAKVVKE